jgi:hypothetical protein
MAEIESNKFAGFPYYDDFQDSKKFLKMLFKPGYALQARELTQIQTILQKQISRFANHTFKDGSPVVDGQIAAVPAHFIRIETSVSTTPGQSAPVVPSQFVGKIIENEVTPDLARWKMRMKVLHVEASEAKTSNDTDNYHVLFVEYLSSIPVTGATQATNITNLEELYQYASDNGIALPQTLRVSSTVDETGSEVASDIVCQIKQPDLVLDHIATYGKATLVSCREGIYYIDGAFILASPQTVALRRKARRQSEVLGTLDNNTIEVEWTSAPGTNEQELGFQDDGWKVVEEGSEKLVGARLFQFPSARVGYTIKREIIDADTDKSLLDPAYGSYNYAAPGSDRFKVDLILDQIPFIGKSVLEESEQFKTANFVELTRVVDGIIRYAIKYPIYSEIEETLARRTHDESGSYTVRPFELDIQEYFNDEKICVLRSQVTEIQSDPNTTPNSVVEELGASIIPSGYPVNISVYGYRYNDSNTLELAWKAIVSDADTFLSRQGEVDFRSQGYGTTLLYMVFGNPTEGDVIVSEPYKKGINPNNFFLKSTIPYTEDVELELYTVDDGKERVVLSQFGEEPTKYQTVFPHVSKYSDPRFSGKYTISRLYPEWASTAGDPETSEVAEAIADAKSKLIVGVGPGKAYIYGYEFENQNTKFLPISKARASESVVGEEVKLLLGNYVICEKPLGDPFVAPSVKIPAWSSLPKVELWKLKGPDGAPLDPENYTLIGTARIRGVSPNEDNVNVHLFDIRVADDEYFADIDHILYRYANQGSDGELLGDVPGTVKLFAISTQGGPNNTGGVVATRVPGTDSEGQPITIVYYDTVLFSPKSNLAVFDIPSLCSLKDVVEFAKVKYDCKKVFSKQLGPGGGPNFVPNTNLVWRQYGSGNDRMWVLCNQSAGAGIVANTTSVSPQTLYTFKASTPLVGGGILDGAAFQTSVNTALSTNLSFYQADDIENLMVFDTQTNELLTLGAISDTNNPIKAIVNADKTVLYIVYKPIGGTDPLGITASQFMLDAVVSCQTDNNTTPRVNTRLKRAKVISQYNTSGFWSKYFDQDGYFMLPLQNWDGVFTFNGSADTEDPWISSFEPEADNGWEALWPGDDDDEAFDTNTNSFNSTDLPEEYITNLGFSDVLSVDEVLIWDASSPTGKRDVTKYFEFVSNTTDNIYDHSSIVIRKTSLKALKAETNDQAFRNPGGFLDYTLFVRFKFLEHSGSGPFIVNSYNHPEHHPFFNQYEDIPLYTSKVYGHTFELRNCLDYRPARENCSPARVATSLAAATDTAQGNNPNAFDISCPIRDNSLLDPQSSTFISRGARGESETILPAMGTTGSRPAISYDYYTSRRDKLVLLKSREFQIIEGKPAIRPESPKDVPESMPLYTLSLPQYTFGAEDVLVDYIDNKRFTMNDIAKLEKRIERVEYYTTLSLLEKEAAEMSIPDSALGSVDRIKNGIFVDNFKGHGVGDVFNQYYSCSMDFERGHLRPRFISRNIVFKPAVQSDEPFVVSPDGLVTFKYESVPYIVQPLASTAISVNPFDVVNWLGSLSLAPSSDTWIDTSTRPAVTINLEGENDAWQAMQNAFGTQWNDWETNWSGVRASTTETLSERTTNAFLDAPHTRRAPDGVMRQRRESTTTRTSLVTETIEQRQTREGIRTTITPQRVTRELGDRVVDVSILPFIRARKITITGKGLKPNTVLYAFFDNTQVNQFCQVYSDTRELVEVTPSTPIRSNSKGEVEVVFNLPGGTFRTGERQFRLTDSPTNDNSRSNTSGDNSYFAQGLLQTRENTIVSTRVPVVTRQSVSEERVVRDVVTRVQTDSSSTVQWVDPLAQTFLVDIARNPNGIWVHSVDLFFKNKPTGDSVPPVRVQIRPTVNGYPHSSVVIPFAESIVDAENVRTTQGLVASDIPSVQNTNSSTRFAFSSPVYLVPGEYAIVVMSNSSDYECYIAEMGEIAIGTENARITQQPYGGVFFKSQNASTWSADQNTDLMFVINSCAFVLPDEPVSVSFSPVFGAEGFANAQESFSVDAMKIMAQLLKFEGTDVGAKLVLTNNNNQSREFPVPLNENFATRPLSFTMKSNTKLAFECFSSDRSLSPCIDADRVSAILIDNIIGPLEPAATSHGVEFAARPPYEIGDPLYPVSRYISRRVDLLTGLESDDLKVYLSANLPNLTYVNGANSQNIEVKTNIEVWAKIQTADSNIPFDDLNWMKMELNPLQVDMTASDESTFTEYSYSLPEFFYPASNGNAPRTGYSRASQQMAVPFTRYAIKIVMYSNTGTIVPKVKDLRVIAVV